MTEKKAMSWSEHKGCDSCLLEDEKTVEQSVRNFSKVLMDSIQHVFGSICNKMLISCDQAWMRIYPIFERC